MSVSDSDVAGLDGILAGLDEGIKLGIEQLEPRSRKGWRESIALPHDADAEYILDYLRNQHGGGRYRLRPMATGPGGGFRKGSVTVTVAPVEHASTAPGYAPAGFAPPGYPYYGRPMYQHAPASHGAPYVIQTPAPRGTDPKLVHELAGLITGLAGKPAGSPIPAQVWDLVTRIADRSATPAAPQTASAGIRDTLETMMLMKELRGVLGDDAGSSSSSSGGWQMPDNPLEMMMMMWMMKNGMGPQGPQAGMMPGQGAPGMVPGMMPGMMPGQGMPGMPQQGPYAAYQHAQARAQYQAQAQQQRPQQRPHAPHQHAPTPAASPATPASPASADDDEEYDDLTADEVVEHLNELGPAEALAFFHKVSAGLSPEIQARMLQDLQGGGGAPPQPPQHQPAPAVSPAFDFNYPQVVNGDFGGGEPQR